MYTSGLIAVIGVMVIWIVLQRPIIWYKAVIIALIFGMLALSISSIAKYLYSHSVTSDVELLHGQVIKKNRVQRTCQVGWRDFKDSFCTEYHTREVVDYVSWEGTGENRHMVTHYKTQYNYYYPYEVKWYIDTTVGNYQISRVERQGKLEPSRYRKASIGDPATKSHYYNNWVFASSLMQYPNPKTGYKIPNQPSVYDYYNTNLVINKTGIDTKSWNTDIRNWLRINGYKKQVSVVVVLTDKPQMFFSQLMYTWRGGEKNQVIMVFGVKNNEINWFNSSSFAKGYNNSDLHAKLKMYWSDHTKSFDIKPYLSIIRDNFHRYSMKNMEYLKSTIDISWYWHVLFGIICSIMGGGTLILSIKKDLTYVTIRPLGRWDI